MSITWIEASAGTGKTYTLVQTVLDLVRTQGLPVDKILMVTFTDKATAELKTRIRAGLRQAWKETRDPALARALENLPSLSITTIHGFCRALLTQFPLESGVSFEPEMVDQGRQWRKLLRDELRPRLGTLDGKLLAWAALEEEEDVLGLAREALDRNVFGLPVSHPTQGELDTFTRERDRLEARTGPLWEAVDDLSALNLPDDPAAALGLENIKANLWGGRFETPYRQVVTLSKARTFRDMASLIDPESVKILEKWDEGGTVWKKNASPPFSGTLEEVRSGALRFAAGVRAAESALPPGSDLGSFMAGCARYQVLKELCLPVLERRSDRELTFHDLIDRVHKLVTQDPGTGLAAGASARWKAVLIDEFQDTDREQWEIFSSLFANPAHDLYLVGDPKQSIYRFRGADLGVYRQAREQVARMGARKLVLTENFRSTGEQIAAVNRLFSPEMVPWDHPDDFIPSKKGEKAVGALVRREEDGSYTPLSPLDVYLDAKDQSWHRHLVRTVLGLLDGRHFLFDGTGAKPLEPGDFLVLVRKKREAWALFRLFTAKGIPATVGGSGGLLQGREAQEVLLFLKALESPRSLASARALGWTTLFAGADPEVLAPVLEAAGDDADRGAYLGAFRRVAAALEPGVTDGGGLEQILARPQGARWVTNVEQVLELVQERHHRGEVPRGQAALCLETWIHSKLQEDEVDLRRDTEARTLKLMTVHGAKGLEAPVVLHGQPPGDSHTQALKKLSWVVGRDVDFLKTAPSLEEEQKRMVSDDLRLRYVALTRARAFQVFSDSGYPGALTVPPADGWKDLARWPGALAGGPRGPRLGDPVEGLFRRHPWVESHSGLWRRATQGEEGKHTVLDRPGRLGDDEGPETVETSVAGELPAGPAFGDLVHGILEEADYRDWAPLATEDRKAIADRLVSDHCQRQRSAFRNRDLSVPLGTWLGRVFRHPLNLGPGTRPLELTALSPEESRRETEFHLPLSLGVPQNFDWGGRIFTVHPGFLTGRIDLVFRWEGKLYLADWKTNRLAPGQTPGELMADAGYDLQAQWYWEALTRLCRLHPGDPAPGGVLYIFLRGPGDSPLGVFLGPEDLGRIQTLNPFFPEAPRG